MAKRTATKQAKDRQVVDAVVGGFAGRPYYPPYFDPRSVVDWFSSWVYICCKRNATAVSNQFLRMYSREKTNRKTSKITQKRANYVKATMSRYMTDETQEVVDHPWLQVIDYVNPILDRQGLFYLTTVSLQINGNSYWKLKKDKLGRITEIWWLPSHFVQPIFGGENVIDYYRFRHLKGYTDFSTDDVLHIRFPSPLDMIGGLGDLQGVFYAAETNKRMEEWENALFSNFAVPDLLLTPEEDVTGPQIQALQRSWDETYGTWRNRGKAAIAPFKLKPERLSDSVKDLQFPEGRKWILDQLAAGFGVPVPVILQDAAKYNNMRHGLYLWMHDTIKPILTGIAEAINTKIMPMYSENGTAWDDFTIGSRSKWFVCFDDPVPEDVDADAKRFAELYAGGLMTANESRHGLGLPDTDDEYGEERLVPSGVRTHDEIMSGCEMNQAQAGKHKLDTTIGERQLISEALRTEGTGDAEQDARLARLAFSLKEITDAARAFIEAKDDEMANMFRDVIADMMNMPKPTPIQTMAPGIVNPEQSAVEVPGVTHTQEEPDVGDKPQGKEGDGKDSKAIIEDCERRSVLAPLVRGKLSEVDVEDQPAEQRAESRISDVLRRWEVWALAALLFDETPLTTVPSWVVTELTSITYETHLQALSSGVSAGSEEIIGRSIDVAIPTAQQLQERAAQLAAQSVQTIIEGRIEELTRRVEALPDSPTPTDIQTTAAGAFTDAAIPAMIAATIVTRSINDGAEMVWTASGIAMKMWISQAGACEYCAPLHGTIIPVGDPFKTSWSRKPEIENPPLHPNCRCAIAAVME